MNIISTNCLGGFIYRDILNTSYKNPFIWTSFDFENFKILLSDYDKINFENVELYKVGEGFSNNFNLRIDDKITLKNNHIFFAEKENKPLKRNNCVFYNKPWEYIIEKYNNRIKRMDDNLVIMIYDTKLSQNEINEICSICELKKYPALIITKKEIIETNLIKKIDFETHEGDWIKPLLKKCKLDIINFINDLSNSLV